MTGIVDTDREILLRLNPRSLFRMLTVNQYWSTIDGEYFWSLKLEQDYSIFKAIYTHVTDKKRYLALSNPKQDYKKFFEWNYIPSLKSEINFDQGFTDKAYENVINILANYKYRLITDDSYKSIFSRKYASYHCGDCTNVACPCTLCIIEHYILKGFKYWNKLRDWEGNDVHFSKIIEICDYMNPFYVQERTIINQSGGHFDFNKAKYLFLSFKEEYELYQQRK